MVRLLRDDHREGELKTAYSLAEESWYYYEKQKLAVVLGTPY